MMRGAETDPLVVVAILNWNNLPDTLECIESVRASDYPAVAIWVVDNGSEPDPTPDLLRGRAPVRVLRQAHNLGYGGGNNVALRAAMSEGAAYVLLLNNDAVLSRDTITRVTAAMEANPHIGMATPRVFFYDSPSEVYWDGGRINWRSGETPHDSRDLAATDGIVKSEWLDGCCLCVRVNAIREIGLLDERYFLYYEDVEWTVRSSRRGWMNAVVTAASARHKVSRSTGSFTGPRATFYYTRNRSRFLQAHGRFGHSPTHLVLYALTAYADYRLRVDWPASRRAVLEAYWSLLRGQWGEYVPVRYRVVLVGADSIVLCLTRIASLLKRLFFCIRRGRIRARFTRSGRVANRP